MPLQHFKDEVGSLNIFFLFYLARLYHLCSPSVHHLCWYQKALAAHSFPHSLISSLNKLWFGGSVVNLIQCEGPWKAVINVQSVNGRQHLPLPTPTKEDCVCI